jgi:thiamine kinase-like enzyme
MLDLATEQLCQRDPLLPALRYAFDPVAVESSLRKVFMSQSLGNVVLDYVRYKPGQHCVARVHFQRNAEPQMGYLKVHAAHRWAKYASSRADNGLHDAHDASNVDAHTFTLVPGVMFYSFPQDHAVRINRLYRSPQDTRALLTRLVERHSNSAELTSEIRDGNFLLQVLAYKPERRCVLQLSINDVPRSIIKLYSAPGFPGALASAHHFRSTMDASLSQHTGKSRRHRMIGFDWLNGASVDIRLFTNEQFAIKLGCALRSVHEHSTAELRKMTRADLQRRVKQVSDDVTMLCPNLTALVHRVGTRLLHALRSTESEVVACHGDLHSGQIIGDASRIGLLDFDSALAGPAMLDLGNLLSELHFTQLSQGSISTDELAAFQATFMSSYNSRRPSAGSTVAMWISYGLWNVVTRPFRQRHPSWDELTEKLVRHVDALLADSPTRQHSFSHRSSKRQGVDADAPTNSRRRLEKLPSNGDLDARLFDSSWMERRTMQEPHAERLLHSHRLTNISLLRHKVDRRALLAYEWHSSDGVTNGGRPPVLLGKVRMKGFDDRTFRLHQRLWAGAFGPQSADMIHVAFPVAAIPELRMWMQLRMPGSTAAERLESNGGRDACRVADALYKLHHAAVEWDREHSVGDEVRILDERLERLLIERHDLSAPLARVRQHCRQLAGCLSPQARVLLHRDFYQDQVLIDGDRVTLIDLDLASWGHAAIDVGNYIAHLMELGLRSQGDLHAFAEPIQLFQAQYCRRAECLSEHDIQIGITLSLARHLSLSRQFPERWHTTERLLEEVLARLRTHATWGRVPRGDKRAGNGSHAASSFVEFSEGA